MRVPLLRWPGGCYADHYHWRDGVGSNRPRRLGLSCGLTVEDDNSLGTHEFLRLCELIGAEPYLAGNMGSGSVQELCDWMEYCNCPFDTTLTQERRANGRAAPFGVRIWGVGNENWGCGGSYDAETYTHEFRRYATMMRHVDATAELVACGFEADWNRKLMEILRDNLDLVDHISIHRYWTGGGPGEAFSQTEYERLISEADQTEAFIVETRAIVEEVAAGRRHIGIALDEWGVWHPEARTWGPGAMDTITPGYEQAGTLRDAIAAAVALEGFHRQCQSLSMANLAQVVNVLHAPVMTDGSKVWLTPTYHLLKMHSVHAGAVALPVIVDGDEISATASLKDHAVNVTVTNRSYTQPKEIRIPTLGTVTSSDILTGSLPRAQNSHEMPDLVRVESRGWEEKEGEAVAYMPPHSVLTLGFGG